MINSISSHNSWIHRKNLFHHTYLLRHRKFVDFLCHYGLVVVRKVVLLLFLILVCLTSFRVLFDAVTDNKLIVVNCVLLFGTSR